jgi:hypothetical protein
MGKCYSVVDLVSASHVMVAVSTTPPSLHQSTTPSDVVLDGRNSFRSSPGILSHNPVLQLVASPRHNPVLDPTQVLLLTAFVKTTSVSAWESRMRLHDALFAYMGTDLTGVIGT